MAADEDIKRLDGRIDGVVRDQSDLIQRVARVEQRTRDHSQQIGRVNEVDKNVVALAAEFKEFRGGIREDITDLRDQGDKILAAFDRERRERAEDKEHARRTKEKERKEREDARTQAKDRVWTRLLAVAGVIAVLIGAFAAALLTVH